MNTIDKNPSVLKNEFKSRRIAGIMFSLLFAFLTGFLIYDFNYLQESLLKTATVSFILVSLFSFFCYALNCPTSKFEAQKHKKDSKLLVIMASSLLLFSFMAYPICKSIGASITYKQINLSIIRSYDNKTPTNINYANFKKDMDENNLDKLIHYNMNRDELESVDTNLVMNIILIKENIKNLTIKNKIEEIYNDKYISKIEYTALKQYILDNPNEDVALAQLVSR